jgi:hypothetical protein
VAWFLVSSFSFYERFKIRTCTQSLTDWLYARGHPVRPFGVARLATSYAPCCCAGLAGPILAWQWWATMSHWPPAGQQLAWCPVALPHPAASTAAQAAVAACTVLCCCSPHRSVHEGLPLLTAPSPRRRIRLRLVSLPRSSPCQLWHCGHAGRVSRGRARLSIAPARVYPLPRRPHLAKHGRAEPTYPSLCHHGRRTRAINSARWSRFGSIHHAYGFAFKSPLVARPHPALSGVRPNSNFGALPATMPIRPSRPLSMVASSQPP